MTKYTIKIDLGNAAFADGNEGLAVACILRDLADKCELTDTACDTRLMDANGNHVGDAIRS